MFLLNRVALGLMLRPKAKQPDHKSETRAAVKTVSRSPELEVSFTGCIWALDSDEDRVELVSTSCTSL